MHFSITIIIINLKFKFLLKNKVMFKRNHQKGLGISLVLEIKWSIKYTVSASITDQTGPYFNHSKWTLEIR